MNEVIINPYQVPVAVLAGSFWIVPEGWFVKLLNVNTGAVVELSPEQTYTFTTLGPKRIFVTQTNGQEATYSLAVIDGRFLATQNLFYLVTEDDRRIEV